MQSAWVLNRGTIEAPALDTLHQGIWRAEPMAGWQVGLGHLWLRERPLGRPTVCRNPRQPSRNAESFLGVVKGTGGDTSVAFVDSLMRTKLLWLWVRLQSMRAVATGPDGFVEVRTGMRTAYNLSQTSLDDRPHFFQPVALPTWHVAWTAGLGCGLKIYRGRMVRWASMWTCFNSPKPLKK